MGLSIGLLPKAQGLGWVKGWCLILYLPTFGRILFQIKFTLLLDRHHNASRTKNSKPLEPFYLNLEKAINHQPDHHLIFIIEVDN